jgi:hypothetical protein
MHVFNAFTALFLMRKEELPVHINTCCQLLDSLPYRHTGGGCHAFRAATSHLLPSLPLHFFTPFAFAFAFPFFFFFAFCSTAAAIAVHFDSGFAHYFTRFELSSNAMSGYNDPEMLKAAIELAQSFSRTKGGGKHNTGGGGMGGRKEHFEPHQPRQQSRYGQVAAPPRQTFTPSAPPLRPLAPPPSRRNYGGSGDFATRRAACRPVIGNLGRDFLISSGVEAEPEPPSKLAPPSSRHRLLKTWSNGDADSSKRIRKLLESPSPYLAKNFKRAL